LKQSILRGAGYGLLAWLAYGVVEFAITCVISRFFRPEAKLLGWQWPLIAMLFGVYALSGLLLGVAGGACLAKIGRTRHESWAVLTLVIAFLANLMTAWPLARSEYIALGVGIMLGAILTASLASEAWMKRTSFLGPWTVSSLFLASPWISREALHDQSAVVKTVASILLLSAIFVLAAWANQLRSLRIITMGRQAATVSTVLVLLSISVWISGRNAPAYTDKSTTSSAISSKPNVVLITMDTVRADHLSVYGYQRDTTPNLREFARKATIYTRAVSPADFTLPSHASIFTGLYPSWHGAQYSPPEYPFGRPLASTQVTLAGLLRASGYRTAATVANYAYLNPMEGMAQGFSVYDAREIARLSESARPFYLREGARRILSLVIDTRMFYAITRRAGDINQFAFAQLEQFKRDRPFFLFLNYMDAHRPYLPPPPFDVRYPGRDRLFSPSTHEKAWKAVNSGKRSLTDAERNHLISQYDGGIAYLDLEIGNLLVWLREMGLYETALIIITSDHGEAFGKHQLMEHAVSSVYQEHVHVPLLVKYPGQHQPQESSALASLVDLMPTILDIAGISVPAAVQGKTLRSPRTGVADVVYSEATTITTLYDLNPRFRGIRRALFAGPLKLITWTAGAPELYDLATDPREEHNLYRADDPRAIELMSKIGDWTKAIPRYVAQPGKLDKAGIERLKSLGYVQ
jgi:arylsulfatase A-like enzyme